MKIEDTSKSFVAAQTAKELTRRREVSLRRAGVQAGSRREMSRDGTNVPGPCEVCERGVPCLLTRRFPF